MAYTYYDCRNLTGTAVCGAKVTNMVDTYYNCRNITNIIIYALTPPKISKNTFYGIPNSVLIYVYANVLNTYKNASIWNTLSSRLRAM